LPVSHITKCHHPSPSHCFRLYVISQIMGNTQPNALYEVSSTDAAPQVSEQKMAALVKQLLAAIPGGEKSYNENPKMCDFMAAACLRNRHYDVASATERFVNYLKFRREILGSLAPQNIAEDTAVQNYFKLGMMRLLSGRTPQGHAIISNRLKLSRPDLYNADVVVRAFHFMMMRALQHPLTASAGIIMIGDLDGAGRQNMDFNVPKKIISALRKNMPVRVAGIIICRPNIVFRIAFPVISLFMSKKMLSRIRKVHDSDFPHGLQKLGIPADILPDDLGGSHNYKATFLESSVECLDPIEIEE